MDESGGSEGLNLRSPGSVDIFYGEGGKRIPFDIKVDKKALEKYLDEEGVVNGRRVEVRFYFPERTFLGVLLGRGKTGNNGEDLPRYWLGRAVRAKENAAIIEINAVLAYEMAVGMAMGSNADLSKNFQERLGFVLGHEIQHLRQTGGEGEYQELKLSEHNGVLGLMERVGSQLIKLTPREMEANRIGKQEKRNLGNIIGVSIRDEEMLKKENFWGQIRELNSEVIQIIKGGFQQGGFKQ